MMKHEIASEMMRSRNHTDKSKPLVRTAGSWIGAGATAINGVSACSCIVSHYTDEAVAV